MTTPLHTPAYAEIPFLEGDFSAEFPQLLITKLLQQVAPIAVSVVNWPSEYPDAPKVTLRLAYGDEALLLYYEVTEGAVVARATNYNGNVWEDSCVELFLDPKGDGFYYNLEVNCIGTPLLGVGEGRTGRVHCAEADMQAIQTFSSLGSLPFEEREGPVSWNLAVMVPYRLLQLEGPEALSGKRIGGNIYKCADRLSRPHYVTWSPIGTPHPDYHRSNYFGTFYFLPKQASFSACCQ
ncbi:MAG: carbohydrate-binding family 9-like protein [Bacteroidales bacterium]